MIGALLTGLVAGIVGRLLVPDMWSELHGPTSWLFSLVLGLTGALLGYLIFTVGLGIGDTDVFDFGGIVGAVIGVVILLPFVGMYARVEETIQHALARRSGCTHWTTKAVSRTAAVRPAPLLRRRPRARCPVGASCGTS